MLGRRSKASQIVFRHSGADAKPAAGIESGIEAAPKAVDPNPPANNRLPYQPITP